MFDTIVYGPSPATWKRLVSTVDALIDGHNQLLADHEALARAHNAIVAQLGDRLQESTDLLLTQSRQIERLKRRISRLEPPRVTPGRPDE